ncbi:transcriptional regulator [Streptomyces cavourensis]|jgi:DNA-binding response OmpR family regulator|uniref:helix-turn-helix domain-containing protein n=1 Tax=unclassified Achromobacter TaxID=2626865 RepID=UPI000E012872|nr:transcriptional regulator [Streptomyces cavourensis]
MTVPVPRASVPPAVAATASSRPAAAPKRAAAAEADPAAATAFPTDGWWSLAYRGWTLLTPAGARLDLTEVERACFQCLLHNPRRELLREELMAVRQGTNLRTLNVAICRLRRKVRHLDARLPLHTVHGAGYVFLGNLREISDL